MNRISPLVRGLLAIALVAALIVVFNQQRSLATATTLLNLAFFLALGVIAYMLWRDLGRREISIWPTRAQQIFYGAVGLLVLDLAWFFGIGVSGLDALVCFVVGGVCIYAGLRVWRDQRSYG